MVCMRRITDLLYDDYIACFMTMYVAMYFTFTMQYVLYKFARKHSRLFQTVGERFMNSEWIVLHDIGT